MAQNGLRGPESLRWAAAFPAWPPWHNPLCHGGSSGQQPVMLRDWCAGGWAFRAAQPSSSGLEGRGWLWMLFRTENTLPATYCSTASYPTLKRSIPSRKILDHTDLPLFHSEHTWPARCSRHYLGTALRCCFGFLYDYCPLWLPLCESICGHILS